jgi:hypothetical protein
VISGNECRQGGSIHQIIAQKHEVAAQRSLSSCSTHA